MFIKHSRGYWVEGWIHANNICILYGFLMLSLLMSMMWFADSILFYVYIYENIYINSMVDEQVVQEMMYSSRKGKFIVL